MLLGTFLQGHEPVEHFCVVSRFFDPFRSRPARPGRWNDDIASRLPIGGGSYVLLIRHLHGDEQPLDFLHVSPVAKRIVKDGPDDGFGINDEDSPYGLGRAGGRLEHAERFGDLHGQIADDREGDLNAFHFVVFDFFLDRSQPCDVAVGAIDGQAEQFAVEFFEFRLHACKRHEFRRTDRSEVSRMREENNPLPLVVFGKLDGSLGAFPLQRTGPVRRSTVVCRYNTWFTPWSWFIRMLPGTRRLHESICRVVRRTTLP